MHGAYIIKHHASGREYVGSSVDLYKRLVKHRSELNKNQHHSPKLQNAWNKYGAEAFEMRVVEFVDDASVVLDVEQRWLDERVPFYNTCKVAKNRSGFKASDETKRRQSESLTGLKRTAEQIENIRQSQLGKTLSDEHRAKCGRPGVPKPDGFGEKLRAANLGRKMTESGVEKMAESKRKAYIFVSPEGTEQSVIGLRKFCKENDLNPSSMSAIAMGKKISPLHRGWTCWFNDEITYESKDAPQPLH